LLVNLLIFWMIGGRNFAWPSALTVSNQAVYLLCLILSYPLTDSVYFGCPKPWDQPNSQFYCHDTFGEIGHLLWKMHITWNCMKLTHLILLGRLLRVDLITYMVRKMSIRSCVRPSTKSFFDFSEIWFVGRGQWVMHDGVQYDLIQGQSHEPLKVGKSAIFKGYFLPQLWWGLANDHGLLN